MDLKKITHELYSMIIFRKLLENNVFRHMLTFIETPKDDTVKLLYSYSGFCSELIKETENFSSYVLKIVLENENPFVLNYSQNRNISAELKKCLDTELNILENFSRISSDDLKNYINYKGYLFKWETSNYDFKTIYSERIAHISEHGYGIFAGYHAFTFDIDKLTPVKSPDYIEFSRLKGYENERKKVIENTLALINGKPAANVLLYGDAGTGKSTTVKSVANELYNKGLRLIELTKKQLRDIPKIVSMLSSNPLKFILFIDDLSFNKDDDDFSALKAILEGSVASKASNIVVYATSNRRHLIKETFSARDGDDIHENDTREELISLSARFGLTVIFLKPDKKLYMEIIQKLAEENHIEIEYDELSMQAEAFALRKGGRSPRTAKQFIDSLLSC